jgi:hypothetical protein
LLLDVAGRILSPLRQRDRACDASPNAFKHPSPFAIRFAPGNLLDSRSCGSRRSGAARRFDLHALGRAQQATAIARVFSD